MELIDTLAESKVKSTLIQEKVEESARVEQEIDVARERYRPVAYQTSILYFAVAALSNVDPMHCLEPKISLTRAVRTATNERFTRGTQRRSDLAEPCSNPPVYLQRDSLCVW